MADGIVFRRTGGRIHWLYTAGSGIAPFAAGLLLPEGKAAADAITLADSLGLGATYLFLRGTPAVDGAAFAAAVGQIPGAGPRVLWLDNPEEDAADWGGALLPLTGSEATLVPLACHGLLVGAGTVAAGDGVLTWGSAAHLAAGEGESERIAVTGLSLSFAPETAGCLTATATIVGSQLAGLGLTCLPMPGDPDLAFPLFAEAMSTPAVLSLDPLHPCEPARTFIRLDGASFASAFRTPAGPAELIPDGPPLVTLGEDGLAGLAGRFRLSGDELICGLSSDEILRLGTDCRLVFSPSPDFGTLVAVDGGDARLVWTPRPHLAMAVLGGEARRFRPPAKGGSGWPPTASLGDLAGDFPILPYGATQVDAAICQDLETALAPARLSLFRQVQTAKPRPRVGVPAQPPAPPIAKPPPPKGALPPPGWELPGTSDERTVGSVARFGNGTVSLELSGLPAEFVRALAFRPAERPPLLLVEDGGNLDGAECVLKVGGESFSLPPSRWKALGTVLVIRAGTVSRRLEEAAGVCAWPAVAAEDRDLLGKWLTAVAARCRSGAADVSAVAAAILDGRKGGVVLVGGQAGLPLALAGHLDGMLGDAARIRPPSWSLAMAAEVEPQAGQASVAVSVGLRIAEPAEGSTDVRLAAVTARHGGQGDWEARLDFRLAGLLGEPFRDGRLELLLGRESNGAETFAPPAVPLSTERGMVESARIDAVHKVTRGKACRLELSGRLALRKLDPDLLSFEALPFRGLALELRSGSPLPRLALDDAGLAIDGAQATARKGSLYDAFPLAAPVLLRDREGMPPQDKGFLPVTCRGAAGKPQAGWCGLAFRAELGTLGAMAAGAGLAADLLVAWQPGPEPGGVAVGLKLPGSASKPALTLAGLIRLGFSAITLEVRGKEKLSYSLRLQEMKVSLFNIGGFPPGRTDLILLGNPAGRGARPALGWFAAYAKGGKAKKT